MKTKKQEPIHLTWTTKEGEEIKLADLTDEHLINIIKMLIRSWKTAHKHACDHMNDGTTISSASDMMPDPDFDWFKPQQIDDLVLVARSRGLKL